MTDTADGDPRQHSPRYRTSTFLVIINKCQLILSLTRWANFTLSCNKLKCSNTIGRNRAPWPVAKSSEGSNREITFRPTLLNVVKVFGELQKSIISGIPWIRINISD